MHAFAAFGGPLEWLLALGVLGSLAFYVAGFYGARRFARQARALNGYAHDDPELPGVTVLKPLKGLDADLYENLSTFCQQAYPRFQIVFGVADAADPAVQVVRRLQASYPSVDIDLVIDGRVYGTNYKVSNLHNMYQVARHDVIVIADSDIRVPPEYLRRIVQGLDEPQVGVLTCLYRAVSTGGLPTRIESLFINTDFAPMVLVAGVVEKPTYAFGATMALRRRVLDSVGGFLPLANYLADDYHLGNRVAERGYRLALSDMMVDTVLDVGSWKRLFDHQLRWARTYRNCRPGGYFSSILTHGSLWALLTLLFNHFSAASCLAASLLYGIRVATSSAIANHYLHAPLRWYEALLLPLKDLFVSAIWVLSYFGETVRWSGHAFRVLSDGQMIRLSPSVRRPQTPIAYPSPVPNEHDQRATL